MPIHGTLGTVLPVLQVLVRALLIDNDIHRKVEMRLIVYTVLAYGTAGPGDGTADAWLSRSSHTRVAASLRGGLAPDIPSIDVPKTSDDYLFH